MDLGVAPHVVLPYVANLSEYTKWMPLVHAVTEVASDEWIVELRAKVGVFARSKRLTMRRVTHSDDVLVFERHEHDNRQHAPWIMKVAVTEIPSGSRVQIDLTYGGNLWTAGVLDKILAHQVDLGKKSLAELVTHSF